MHPPGTLKSLSGLASVAVLLLSTQIATATPSLDSHDGQAVLAARHDAGAVEVVLSERDLPLLEQALQRRSKRKLSNYHGLVGPARLLLIAVHPKR